MTRIFFKILAILLPLTCGYDALAHSMNQSAILLDYHSSYIDAQMELPPARLSKAFGVDLTADTLDLQRAALAPYILSRIYILSPSKTPWNIEQTRALTWEMIDGAPYVVAHLRFTPPPGTSVRRLVLGNSLITDRLPNHVVLVSIRSDWDSGTFADDPELVGVLNKEERSIEIGRGSGNWMHGFSSIFHLGVRHIAEGTDHLLFLLALLLPAPLLCHDGRWMGFAGVKHGFIQILKVVTAFTLGHSLTLALAASGVVHVPGRPIEILIAVSILVSAVHAARPVFPGREAFIAGSFGLIHGLAFASTLAELGLHRWERVASILSFNLGIEAMQLLVVLCIMPSLMLLSRTPFYRPVRIVGATFAGLAACGWILERALNRNVHVDVAVDSIAKHAPVYAVALFACSVAASLLAARRNPI